TTGKSYKCTVTADNARGTSLAATPSAAVIVGSPAAPKSVHATRVSAGKLRVSFVPGAANGSAITSFTAQCTPTANGKAGHAAGTASQRSITVIHLTPGAHYACTVSAKNGRGDGLPSAASVSVSA